MFFVVIRKLFVSCSYWQFQSINYSILSFDNRTTKDFSQTYQWHIHPSVNSHNKYHILSVIFIGIDLSIFTTIQRNNLLLLSSNIQFYPYRIRFWWNSWWYFCFIRNSTKSHLSNFPYSCPSNSRHLSDSRLDDMCTSNHTSSK